MEDLLRRQIPHDIGAEQSVLGAMLIDARTVSEVTKILTAEDFYANVNKDIYNTIFSMFSNGLLVDPVTVLDQMRKDGVWTDESDAYIRDIMIVTPIASNAIAYAEVVKNLSLLRDIADAGSDINTMAISGEGGAMSILEAAEKKVYSLRKERSRASLESIRDIMNDVYEQVKKTAASGSGMPGISTGFYELDKKILGLNEADLIIIASRPGMGKTALALNIAINVATKADKTVAVFSLEMSRDQLALRLLSSAALVDGKKLQTGNLSDAEWEKIANAVPYLQNANLLINDDASLTVTEMNAQCRRIDNLGLVIIDYMQLMSAASNERGFRGENRVAIVGEISRTMKVMAKELEVPVICLSQLNRQSDQRKGEDRRPQLSDLRESGSIEQDADILMGLYRAEYYDKETADPNLAECIILKNRRGETGPVPLRWDPQYTNLSTMDWGHSDEDDLP
ncbi:MAG: replicative DNA helicase [Oscillospiraceae bacterium]|jgi:replicative DNA helicase|nr:replicative DNA helicase [Oscillospiraceae bacterium]